MNDQVRLQELIEVVEMLPEEEDHIARPVSGRDLRILVREIERLRDLADEMNNELFSERMTIDVLKWQLQQAQAKAERYKEIVNLFKMAFTTGDAAHLTINGRSVQAMALLEALEGES